MLQTRQSAFRLVKRLRPCTQRRFESSHKSDETHGSTQDHHHQTAPHNESFGRGLYIMIGVIPLGYFLHYRSRNPDPNPGPSLWSQWVPDFREEWERSNALHTAAVEQAGNDRALFINAPHRQNVDLRSNEIFNMGSPYNRHSSNSVNLEGVINHYTQKNRALAEGVKTKTSEQIYAERSS